jgi:tetratricopeptide (TPR) repeat protein
MSHSESAARIDRLLDAIDLVQDNRYEEARTLLRELIREDNDFEDAWLWLSVTVDSLDQSSLCLDNVLRVNPDNALAAGALYRLRESEIRMEQRRERLRLIRDVSLGLFWLLVIALLYAVLFSYIA